MNRRAFLKRMFGSVVVALGLGGGTYYYAREVEPFMLSIQEETIQSKRLSPTFDGFKIVQFSDTHIGFHYPLERFNKLVEEINQLVPDLIVFTGDLIDDPGSFSDQTRLMHLLSQLHAPSGKYWIYGNHDHGGYGTDFIDNIMTEGGFNLLQNNHNLIHQNGENFTLAGIDDTILGNPDVKKAVDGTPAQLFTVLLAHEPDYADTTKNEPVDVQLSGHSHGGQIRVPFIGPLYTPVDAKKYIKGKYVLPGSQLTLFVNKGIGTTRMPYRFLCRPELHLYTLKSNKT